MQKSPSQVVLQGALCVRRVLPVRVKFIEDGGVGEVTSTNPLKRLRYFESFDIMNDMAHLFFVIALLVCTSLRGRSAGQAGIY